MMKKYIVGFMVGVGLTFALQAGAASLLGSTVDAVITVEVDGESLGQAPVIDGVSYLPVRQFGTEAGYKVDFGEGKATLTNVEPVSGTPIEVPVVEPTTTLTPEGDIVTETPPKTHHFTLGTIDGAIKGQEGVLRLAKVNLQFVQEHEYPDVDRYIENVAKEEAALARLIAIKAELQAQ